MVAFLRESIIKSFLIVSNLSVLNHFHICVVQNVAKQKNDRPHLLQIKSWLINFNGVTNKYLQHYLNWHTFNSATNRHKKFYTIKLSGI